MSRGAGNVALRRRVLLTGWLLLSVVLLARAVQVQVVQGAEWDAVAERQHNRTLEVPAPRGTILDRDGTALAVSHERLRVSVAPREIDDAEHVAGLLAGALDLGRGEARRIVRSDDPWIVVPGRYPPRIREELGGVNGIYLRRELERVRPYGELALGLLGTVRSAAGVGGIERAYDSILAGRAGREIQARDHRGRTIPGESFLVERPRAGGELVLTLDVGLQEISREVLTGAIETTEARGGDLLIVDPRTGEILSLVSVRENGAPALTAINAPYEPGSTLKPFTVAGLLGLDLVALGDTLDAEGGRWTVAGRTLTDPVPHDELTVADALRVSSNVGIAKAARAFTPAQQYEILRDFGFGAPTGVELPGEAAGTLRRPEQWSGQSPASLAIGYEVGVTPIQMAMAYSALANGGWLMEPRLVREVRGPDGSVEARPPPRRIRRVVSGPVARRLAGVLVDVVEDGTGVAARLGTFRVAGKSGTSRAYGSRGYEAGGYFSSFVGFFPAEHPQLVVFVKLDRPQGTYYGGATAGPVTRATLEAILAARRAPLDRGALVQRIRRDARLVERASPRFAAARIAAGTPEREPVEAADRATPAEGVPVPDLEGLPVRTAVRRLHALGFRVRWEDRGTTGTPLPGARLVPGDTIPLGGEGQ